MDKQETEEYYKELQMYLDSDDRNVIEFYEKRAEEYDFASRTKSYDYINQYGPQVLKKYLKQECQLKPEKVEVLDIACGTGAIGICLNKAGFLTIDGVDGSNAMLLVSKRLGIYRNLTEGILTDNERFDDIPDGKYDALICIGGIAVNHITVENALPEFIRVLKKGGIAVYAISPTASEVNALTEHIKYLENKKIEMINLEKVFYGDMRGQYNNYCHLYAIKKII